MASTSPVAGISGASATPASTSPAAQLLGITLKSGWLVTQRLVKTGSQTGATFCATYIVERDGKRGFLKAIDFIGALASADPILELRNLTLAATFEKDMLEVCLAAKASKVVQLLDHEYVTLPANAGNPHMAVFCMVTEHGEGDLRKTWDANGGKQKDSWKLRVLRDVALGIEQLHRMGIAHQDVKPSNVLMMNLPTKPQDTKVCDLGGVVRRGHAGPYDSAPWPGDGRYAPLEVFYGFVSPDWQDRREAADAYLLGNLAFFLFTGVGLNPLLMPMVPPSHTPAEWKGSYDDHLLTVLRDALVRCVQQYLIPALPTNSEIRDEIVQLILELTDPSPKKRGDPKARRQAGSPVGLDRYHQKFLRLSNAMQIAERKAAP